MLHREVPHQVIPHGVLEANERGAVVREVGEEGILQLVRVGRFESVGVAVT